MKYSQHKKLWSNCEGCYLHRRRNKFVSLRGDIPCEMLFIGEAPGVSEDTLGIPFVGPAGKLLDSIVNSSEIWKSNRLAFCNLVGCMPKTINGSKSGEPKYLSIMNCTKRVQEIIDMANPQVIIAVGKLAKKYLIDKPIYNIPENAEVIAVMHPAAILRADISQQSLAIHRVKIYLIETAPH